MTAHEEARRGIVPEGHLGTVHPENTRSAAGGSASRHHFMSRKKSQFHQSSRYIFGQIEVVEDAALPHW